jgi:predicted Zn-dependent protease
VIKLGYLMSTTNYYSDRVILEESIIEVAYRDGSLEVNEYNARVESLRVNVDGCWAIVSSQGTARLGTEKALQIAKKTIPRGECGGLSEATLFSGSVVVGVDKFDANSIASELPPLCRDARSVGASVCEAIVLYKRTRRVIEREDGGTAEEVKHIVEIDVAAVAGDRLVAENTVAVVWGRGEVVDRLDKTYEKLLQRLSLAKKTRKPLIPSGPMHVVLDYDVAGALMHEISHLADPLLFQGRLLGTRIASNELTMYDNPRYNLSPTLRFFDDEGVTTQKRVIIDEGRLVDMHHTRSTAGRYGSSPGSAYGLFHRPVGFHTTLIVEPGDWGENEIVEETRHGLYVQGVAMALTEKGYIRIVPEAVYTIKRGEIADLVSVKAIKIPLYKLRTMHAITKTRKLRVSREKEWIVAELSPRVMLEAYVEYP